CSIATAIQKNLCLASYSLSLFLKRNVFIEPPYKFHSIKIEIIPLVANYLYLQFVDFFRQSDGWAMRSAGFQGTLLLFYY
ncbi:MAG: hypothetical protein U9R42_11775, partial [Bacteroidota bacterium]|nr:hypothetical protein [Bacteroidota bacterium]